MVTTISIPNHEIIEKISEGPQAAIYKAYHKRNPERLLALKVLKANFLSEHKRSQFRQKIEHLRVLNDPFVITPIALDAKDGMSFLTQDYFDGVPPRLSPWADEGAIGFHQHA